VKRKISIKKIYAITISVPGSEFVVHVPEEYDYRYSSTERRDPAVLSILRAFKGAPIPLFLKDDLNLTAFTTTKVIYFY
jgi:serum/glucocorticoid-regulated kinase 2